MGSLEDALGHAASSRIGYGCLYVLCIAADGRPCTVPVSKTCDCRRLWMSLTERETRLSITACKQSSLGNGCQEQPTYNFCRNAIVDTLDATCVLISVPFSTSCFLFFNTSEGREVFCRDLAVLRPELVRPNDLELERRLVKKKRIDCYEEYVDPFAESVGKLVNLPGRSEIIIELDAGLGLVSDAILKKSEARLIAITRPDLVPSLGNYLGRAGRTTVTASDINSSEFASVRASALVSRRLDHFLFDCDILKRFLHVRDTKLCERGRLLPSDLIIRAALICDPKLWAEKERRTKFWLTAPHGVRLSRFYNQAVDEEFRVPEISRVSERSIVSNVQEFTHSLMSPGITEESIKKFNLRFEFNTTTCTDVHGIAFWCAAVIDGQEVGIREYYRTADYGYAPKPLALCPDPNVACILKQPWQDTPQDCKVAVDCVFTENRARSYDITLDYALSKPFSRNPRFKYSMMLAMPHPYGKTIRREADVERDDSSNPERRPRAQRIENEDHSRPILQDIPISRGFVC